MIVFRCILGLALLATVHNVAHGQMSPEPAPAEEGLYLYTAGLSSSLVSDIKDGMNICPQEYPTGFNIRCIGESRYAWFEINERWYRSEYAQPFYLAGNVNDRVRPWTNPPGNALISCTLFRPKRIYRAELSFTC